MTRCGITDENTRCLIYLNDQNLSYRLKVNESADLTTCEFASRYSGDKHSNVLSGLQHFENS